MKSGRREKLEEVLERFSCLRVLVVGDLLLDEYRIGEVDRISPEAPVPIVRVMRSDTVLGGAGNVARGIVTLGAECRLVGLVGEDREGEILSGLVEGLGMAGSGLLRSPGRPTSHKLRVVARGQQMLRLDREDVSPLEAERVDRVRAAVAERIGDCDVVVLEDYDKGLFGQGLARWIIALAHDRGIPVVADPKRDPTRFRGASLVKPNLEEALRFVPGSDVDSAARRSLVEKLGHELGGREIVLTRGRAGMTGLDRDGRVFDVPTRPLEVFDVQGAGDTCIAVLGLSLAAGASLRDACIVANAAAAVVVAKVGTAAVTREELKARLPGVLAVQEEET